MWKVVLGLLVWWGLAGAASAAAAAASPPVCADCTKAVVVAEARDAARVAARAVPVDAPQAEAAPVGGGGREVQSYALMLAGVAALIFMAGRRRRD